MSTTQDPEEGRSNHRYSDIKLFVPLTISGALRRTIAIFWANFVPFLILSILQYPLIVLFRNAYPTLLFKIDSEDYAKVVQEIVAQVQIAAFSGQLKGQPNLPMLLLQGGYFRYFLAERWQNLIMPLALTPLLEGAIILTTIKMFSMVITNQRHDSSDNDNDNERSSTSDSSHSRRDHNNSWQTNLQESWYCFWPTLSMVRILCYITSCIVHFLFFAVLAPSVQHLPLSPLLQFIMLVMEDMLLAMPIVIVESKGSIDTLRRSMDLCWRSPYVGKIFLAMFVKFLLFSLGPLIFNEFIFSVLFFPLQPIYSTVVYISLRFQAENNMNQTRLQMEFNTTMRSRNPTTEAKKNSKVAKRLFATSVLIYIVSSLLMDSSSS